MAFENKIQKPGRQKTYTDPGPSAYDVWVRMGNTGTVIDFLESLKGKSAYALALDKGFVGALEMWLASLKGQKGDQGEKGDVGNDGIQGPKGDQGSPGMDGDDGMQGAKGDQGVKGETGAKGDAGQTGATGSQGVTGDQGATGPQGPTGLLLGTVATGKAFGPNSTIITAGTFDVIVNLSVPMPNTTYVVSSNLSGTGTLLGQARIQGIISRTTTTVTVRVLNVAVLGVNFSTLTIEVIAIKLTGTS